MICHWFREEFSAQFRHISAYSFGLPGWLVDQVAPSVYNASDGPCSDRRHFHLGFEPFRLWDRRVRRAHTSLQCWPHLRSSDRSPVCNLHRYHSNPLRISLSIRLPARTGHRRRKACTPKARIRVTENSVSSPSLRPLLLCSPPTLPRRKRPSQSTLNPRCHTRLSSPPSPVSTRNHQKKIAGQKNCQMIVSQTSQNRHMNQKFP